MAFRAVIFDLFDTLVDLSLEGLPQVELSGRLVPSTSGALHAALAARADVDLEGFAQAIREVDRAWRDPAHAEGRELATLDRFAQVVDRLGLEDPELPRILTDVHMGLIAAQASTPPHHARVLGSLGRRVRIGLCSNFSHSPTALGVLEAAGLREHLDAIAISHDVGLRKPRREIFEAVLGELGISPEEALHVGDSLEADVAGAGALGIRTAWITRRVARPEAARAVYQGPDPDWIVRDLEEIEPILETDSRHP